MKFTNRGVQISESADIHPSAKIGDGTIIYDNVKIGANTIVANDCIIGEPTNDYYRNDEYKQPNTVIGSDGLIRSHNIIYAGAEIGNNISTGHHAIVRENSKIGNHCSIGTYTELQGDCEIGNYCRFQSNVSVGQLSRIGDYVFIYPFTVLTNDLTPPSEIYCGSQIGSYTQIASSCVILGNAKIGQHCLIAANSTVGGLFEDDSFIHGSPAVYKGKLSKMPFFNQEGKRHYPWPQNFDRGMPWNKSELKTPKGPSQ